MKKLITILASLLLTTCLLAQQEINFTLTIGGDKVSLYETVDVRFQIEGSMSGAFELPEIDGFEVISSNQSSQFQMINGKTSKQKVYNYKLRAIKDGTFVIPATSIVVNGETYKTKQQEIEVIKDGKIKPPPIKNDSPLFRTEPPVKKRKKRTGVITI